VWHGEHVDGEHVEASTLVHKRNEGGTELQRRALPPSVFSKVMVMKVFLTVGVHTSLLHNDVMTPALY